MRSLDAFPSTLITREQRFVPTTAQLRAFLEHTLGIDLAVKPWDRDRPYEYVRTTYFDTEDLSLFHSTIGRRVRFREYARASTSSEVPAVDRRCYLELKQVNGSLRTKMRCELDRTVLGGDDGLLDVMNALEAAGDAPSSWSATLGFPLRSLRPRVTICYRRVSLGRRAGRIRVTLDHGITFSQPSALGDDLRDPENVVGYGPPHVVEVKHEGALPEWLTDALSVLPAAVKISKFELGIRAVLAGPRSGSRYKAGVEPIPWPIQKTC